MGLAQFADNGMFSARKIAEALHTTSEDIARTAGLGKDAVQRKDRIQSDRTQRRLREVVEIIKGGAALRLRPDGLCLVSIGATFRFFRPDCHAAGA